MRDLSDLRHEFQRPTRGERIAAWLDRHQRALWTAWAILWYLMGMITVDLVWLMTLKGLGR